MLHQTTRRAGLALATTAAAFAAVPAAALTPVLQIYSMAQYQAMPLALRETYVAGVLDADRAMVPFEQAHAKFAQCLTGMTVAQATALVDARVSHPQAQDHGYVPLAVHNALDVDCTRRGYQP
jgi:hypothetical protein